MAIKDLTVRVMFEKFAKIALGAGESATWQDFQTSSASHDYMFIICSTKSRFTRKK